MSGISQDFVRYVMHVQVVEQQSPTLSPTSDSVVKNLQTSSADDEPAGSGFQQAAVDTAVQDAPDRVEAQPTAKQQTVVKTEFDKTPRNAPCPCGSGKKFKQCHGAA